MAKSIPSRTTQAKKSPATRAAGKTSAAKPAASKEVTMDRRDRSVKAEATERRSNDRRTKEVPVVEERRQLERREKVTRRRQIDPTTCEREYSENEVEFMSALELYKRKNGRMFPTCSEILEVITSLGYRKMSEVEASSNTIIETPVFAEAPVNPMQG